MSLSVITLNVNVISAPVKKHRVSEWIGNKTYIYIYALHNPHLRLNCTQKRTSDFISLTDTYT